MSQMEYHIGKLKLLPKIEHETLQEQCKRIYLEHSDPLPEDETNDDWVDILLYSSNTFSYYMIHNDNLYWIFDHNQIDEYDCNINPLGNDIYEFRMGFYNGGTCLEECIGYELDNL